MSIWAAGAGYRNIQSSVVTDDNLNEMLTNAKTPADHEAIAAYYDQQAAEAEKKTALCRNTADTYRN